MKSNDVLVGVAIPIAGLLAVIIGILWWVDPNVLKKFHNVWIVMAIPFVILGIYYSVAWIPKALKG